MEVELALWRIKRLDSQAGANSGLDCEAGSEPVQVTLEDTEGGPDSVVYVCYNTRTLPCDEGGLFDALSVSYPDNDFGCE
jgi:hypothetical protein